MLNFSNENGKEESEENEKPRKPKRIVAVEGEGSLHSLAYDDRRNRLYYIVCGLARPPSVMAMDASCERVVYHG